jgi:hypothetical protein
VIDQHAKEWPASGTFFFVLALAEGLMTVALIAGLRPWVARAGIVISAIPVVVWAWDRSFGLPFGPNKGIRGTIGRSDVLSVLFEIITVVALWPFMQQRYARARPAPLDVIGKVVIGVTVVYVVGFSYWAVIGDDKAVHGAHAAATTTPGNLPTATTAVPRLNPGQDLTPTQTLSYTASEYAFAGPQTAPAAVTRFVLQNSGAEAHDLKVARIPDSSPTPSTPANLQSMFADAEFGRASAPTIVGDTSSTPAGQTATVTIDLTPGRYILGCTNTASDGTPHYALGMITVLTVTPA